MYGNDNAGCSDVLGRQANLKETWEVLSAC
jgi:hypothetical protein